MKPIIHLLGDKYKAQRFVRFAERKLAELKNLMKLQRLQMQNRLIRFTADAVEVYIESYLGIDKIRITAVAITGCNVDFSADVVTGGNPLTVQFAYIQINCEFDTWMWDFGDKRMSFKENPSHTYKEAGNYTVKLKAWKTPQGFLPITYDSDSAAGVVLPLTEVSQEKRGSGSSNIAAYNDFLSDAFDVFISTLDAVSYYGIRRTGVPAGVTYTYYSAIDDYVYDLTTQFSAASVVAVYGTFGSGFPSGLEEVGFTTNIDGRGLLHNDVSTEDEKFFPIIDLESNRVAANTVSVEFRADPPGYVDLNLPGSGDTVEGFVFNIRAREFPYTHIGTKQKNNYITVS
jgi:hypothetical protein